MLINKSFIKKQLIININKKSKSIDTKAFTILENLKHPLLVNFF